MINCYYYAPHNHTLLASHQREDFQRMKSIGSDAVSICVQESQIRNWHQQRLRNAVDLAHEAGLKVFAVPNRWAGLTAGWIDGWGAFSLERYDTLIRDSEDRILAGNGNWEKLSCIHHPDVEKHLFENLEALLHSFSFDGIVWDEPHSHVCFCHYCRERSGGTPTREWQMEETVAFVDRLSMRVKEMKPGATISLFIEPGSLDFFAKWLSAKHLDFVGSDGHVRRAEHHMHRMKTTIFEAHERTFPLIREAGKKSFYLLEAQRHRDEDLDEYLACVESAFSLPMDHLMFYYSAHEMSPKNETRFNEATWAAVKKVARA